MLTYAQISEKGERKNNEDCIAVYERENAYLFVLCDGLGGHGAGDVASSTVVECAKVAFHSDISDTKSLFEEITKSAQVALYKKQKEVNKFGAFKTTMTLLHIKDDLAHFAHIGDSRIYRFDGAKKTERTLDHSVPQMLVMQGEIKDEDIRQHEDRNRLTRVIGNGEELPKITISQVAKINPETRFLLCSDGLWEYVTDEEMESFLADSKNTKAWLNKLVKIAKLRGKGKNMDNFSAICVFCGGEKKRGVFLWR